MRILFVHAAVDFSIGDVSRGYRAALERQGHEIADYDMPRRLTYHQVPLNKFGVNDNALMSKFASETILNEAMYHKAELVVMVSGLNVHPIALWLLDRVRIPIAVIFTESPYDDESQDAWLHINYVDATPNVIVFTNDQYSAKARGWNFLPPSFDPSIHRPVDADPEFACDVVMIGTGWPERQNFLEAVNWDGIDLRLYGIWPGLRDNPNSPLSGFYRPMVIQNDNIAKFYCSAKVCINFHRKSDVAMTPGPRTYELAACGAFQLSDRRHDMRRIFGASIQTFDTPGKLEELIRYYLKHPVERKLAADASLKLVQNETFDQRASEMMSVVAKQLAPIGA